MLLDLDSVYLYIVADPEWFIPDAFPVFHSEWFILDAFPSLDPAPNMARNKAI